MGPEVFPMQKPQRINCYLIEKHSSYTTRLLRLPKKADLPTKLNKLSALRLLNRQQLLDC